jgi:hypothetical protein
MTVRVIIYSHYSVFSPARAVLLTGDLKPIRTIYKNVSEI